MEVIKLGVGAEVRILVSAEATGGECSMIFGTLESGLSGPPPHRHDGFAEVYHVLAGRLELRRGEELLELGPGDSAAVPPGTVHSFRSIGERDAEFFNVYAPGGFERYFREAAEAMPPDRPPDPEVMAEIASRYGLEPVEA